MAIKYNENYNGTRPFSDFCYQIFITDGELKAVQLPGDPTTVYQAEFSYADTSNVFVGLNVDPEMPSASITEQPYVAFKPKKKYVNGGDVLAFATNDAGAYIGVEISTISN